MTTASGPRRAQWHTLVPCLLLAYAAGGLGSLGMRGEDTWTWYAALIKPPVQPPGWVFGPVWSVLYALMGISLWLLLRDGRGRPGFHTALAAFAAQWLLNAAWTPLFFGLRLIAWALADAAGLVLAVVLTIHACARLQRTAAWLLAPYAAWTAFALLLNAWLWVLNP